MRFVRSIIQLGRKCSDPNINPKVCFSSFYDSTPLQDLGEINRKYKVTRDAEEWKYVERLLPPSVVPEPVSKDLYPSGWKPQTNDLKDRPYFVERTKNHMVPVYLHVSQRGMTRLTYLRRVQGDIWRLKEELQEYLQSQFDKPVVQMQVNELCSFICIRGDYVNAAKHFLLEKGY